MLIDHRHLCGCGPRPARFFFEGTGGACAPTGNLLIKKGGFKTGVQAQETKKETKKMETITKVALAIN